MSNNLAELFSVELMELQLQPSSISDQRVTVFKQAWRHKVPLWSETLTRCHTSTSDPCWFLLLGLVDVGAAFAQVEVHLVSGVTSLQLQQSRVFTLVPQTALIAGEDGLTPQSAHTHTHTVNIFNLDRQHLSASCSSEQKHGPHKSQSTWSSYLCEHAPVCKSALSNTRQSSFGWNRAEVFPWQLKALNCIPPHSRGDEVSDAAHGLWAVIYRWRRGT